MHAPSKYITFVSVFSCTLFGKDPVLPVFLECEGRTFSLFGQTLLQKMLMATLL